MHVLSKLRRAAVRLAWPEDRRGLGFLALLLVLVAHCLRYDNFQIKDAHVYSDGYYSWIYVRSLAFDGDIDFKNDYALCGDPGHIGVDEGGGRPANSFYFGPAVYLAPALWVAKHVVTLPPSASDQWKQGCSGLWIWWVGWLSPIAVFVTMWLAYRVARRWYSEAISAGAVLVVGLASPLNVFGTLTWYYSHLWAALSVSIALLFAARANDEPSRPLRWILAGATAGLAALMRPQEGLWGLVPMAAVLSHFLSDRDDDARRAKRDAVIRYALLAVGFIAVFSIQLSVYQKLYGSPFVIPQGKVYVQLGHSHPWLALFSARSGLLYWTPLLWLSIIGGPILVWHADRRLIAVAIVVTMILEHYIASSALSWTGSGTLGARVQTSLAAGFVVTAAAAITWLVKWARRRRLAAGAVVALAILPWLLITWEVGPAGLPNDRPVPAPQLYGTSFQHGAQYTYEKMGNPWTLPATAVFKLRYGAPLVAFDALASDGIYGKNFRTLAPMLPDTFRFDAPPSAYWSENLVKEGKGVRLEPNARGHFLVTLYWPWVNRIRVVASPIGGGEAKLHVRTASFFRGHDLGVMRFTGASDESQELATPESAWDSGINEVILESDAPILLVSWSFFDDKPRDTSPHVFGKK